MRILGAGTARGALFRVAGRAARFRAVGRAALFRVVGRDAVFLLVGRDALRVRLPPPRFGALRFFISSLFKVGQGIHVPQVHVG